MPDPATQWVETEVTRIQLKSAISRVRKTAGGYQVFGFVLNDGTAWQTVEVSSGWRAGPWQSATLDKGNTQFSWKLFTCGSKERYRLVITRWYFTLPI